MKGLVGVVFVLGAIAVGCSSGPSGSGDGGPNNNNSDGGAASDGGGGGSDGSNNNTNGGPITFPATACPTLSACGGAIEGAWDYAGGCVDAPFEDLKQGCPTLQVQNASGTVKGSVTFSGGQVVRKATSQVSATLVLPVACTMGASCVLVQTQLQKVLTSAACTADNSGGCSCAVTRNGAVNDADSYTVQGTKVVTGGGAQYDYCVQGSGLKYKELGNSPKLGGVFDLQKR